MCRLAMFPPRFNRLIAIKTLQDFESYNIDGVGYSYIQDNKFVVKKWPKALSEVLESKGDEFLDHLETCNSWTIAHLRAASHGENAIRNTHPFILNKKWVFMHNGVWSEYYPMKVALSKFINFSGETDTEVAGQFFSFVGPRKFYEALKETSSGVFVGLNRNGNLWIAKTSGDLEKKKIDGQVTFASSFPTGVTSKYVRNGWYKYSQSGELIEKEVDKTDHGFVHLRPYQFKSSKNARRIVDAARDYTNTLPAHYKMDCCE
ncbi:MAG: hypothetical protein EKK57_09440 [Proteobacteria bacterium]|nr:MAG: hypothetical protein EKK57_09440 [Pseudomonadota bacterium]